MTCRDYRLGMQVYCVSAADSDLVSVSVPDYSAMHLWLEGGGRGIAIGTCTRCAESVVYWIPGFGWYTTGVR